MIPVAALKKLFISTYEHYSVEAEVRILLEDTLEHKFIKSKKNSGDIMHYLQRNFFSILFLSIYRALNIPKERRIFYGIINHCLRGIVTGTDNLLDDEYKELLPLNFAADAARFKSVMHILLFDRFMFRIIEQAAEKGFIARKDIDTLHRGIFRTIVPIGAEEAEEEGGIKEILSPADILSSVHMYKGGNLLCLAFVAPEIIETGLAAAVRRARQGVYSIGMALQVIDDITDIYEDIRDKRHNYLVSSIYFEGTHSEKVMLEDVMNEGTANPVRVELAYKKSVSRVMEQAIGEALSGFRKLEESGYWFNQRTAMSIIRNIFHLRGAENLLGLLPSDENIKLSLGECYGESTAYPRTSPESCSLAV